MTRRQVYIMLTSFLGGDWKRAKKAVEIFDHNFCLTFKAIEKISFAYGKYSDLDGNYYGENRDTLNVEYMGKDGEKHYFSILD